MARTLVLNDSIKPLYQSILTSVRLLDFQQHKNNVTNISFISPYYLFLRKALPSCTQLCTHPCLYVFFLLEKEDHPSSSSFLVHFFSPIHLQLIFPSRYILPHHHYHLTITQVIGTLLLCPWLNALCNSSEVVFIYIYHSHLKPA